MNFTAPSVVLGAPLYIMLYFDCIYITGGFSGYIVEHLQAAVWGWYKKVARFSDQLLSQSD